MKVLFLLFFGTLFHSSILAQTLDRPIAYFQTTPTPEFTLTAYPDGSGQTFDDCFANGTSGADATIIVRVKVNGSLAEGIAKERIRLRVDDWTDQTHNRICPGSFFNPDADSDANGLMYFSVGELPIYGTPSSSNFYFIEYEEIENSSSFTRFNNGASITILTPDLNSDGEVNLTDTQM